MSGPPVGRKAFVPHSFLRLSFSGQGVSVNPLTAKVWRIDKVMDAASGTFTVLLRIDNHDLRIPAGVRCAIQF